VANPPDPALSARPWVASYPPGVPPTYRLPPVRLPRLLDDAARDFPEHTALEFGRNQLTYAQLQDHVAELTAGLSTLPGDDADAPLQGVRVLVRVPDGLAVPIVLFALWRAGAVAVPIGPDLALERLADLVEREGIAGAVGSPRLLRRWAFPHLRFAVEVRGDEWDPSRLSRALRRLPARPRPTRWLRRRGGGDGSSVEVDADAGPSAQHGSEPEPVADPELATEPDTDPEVELEPETFRTTIDELLTQATGRTSHARPPVEPHAPALTAVQDTPDGLVLTRHTHRTLLATAFQSRLWVPDVQAGRERVLVAEPMHDLIGSSVGLLAAVLSGATSILVDTSDGSLARTIERTRPTLLVGRSPRIADLAREVEGHRRDLTSLRVCLAIGDGLLPQPARELERRAAGARVRPLHGWGDAAPISHGQPVYGRVVATTIGLPVTSTLAAVVDPDDLDRLCDPEEPGRLLLHGPQIPEDATDDRVGGGWLVTDLLARVDADGWFTVIGRDVEVVDVAGRPRSPARIAAVVRPHRSVREVEVVEVDGRLVVAVVAARRRALEHDALQDALTQHLDPRGLPDEVVVLEELPRVDDGDRVDHEELRARIRDAWQDATLHTDDEDGSGAGPPDPPDAGRPAS